MKNKRLRNYLMAEFDLHMDGLSLRGWGLGTHVFDGTPSKVEVRDALPGDFVRVRVRRLGSDALEAEAIEYHAFGYSRISRRCPHAGSRYDKDTGCGGCTLQQIHYETQVRLKQDFLSRLLQNKGIQCDLLPMLECRMHWQYRNKMELSFGPDGADALGVGLHPAGYKYEVITLRQCDLFSPILAELTQKTVIWAQTLGLSYFVFRKNTGFLRLLTLREGKRTGKTMVILTTSAQAHIDSSDGRTLSAGEVISDFVQNVLMSLTVVPDTFYWSTMSAQTGKPTQIVDHLVFGPPVLHERMHIPDEAHALDFEILPRAFFQPNTFQAERLYATIYALAKPHIQPETPVLDLYCGTGTIALCFARYGHCAVAIDIEAQAIENARANAVKNGLASAVEFFAGDTAEILRQLIDERANFSDYLLIVDPPRRGLLPPAYRQIMRLNLKTILYVSCNPESLACDLAKFCASGYHLESLQPVDMLPQTAHIETVAVLRLRASA